MNKLCGIDEAGRGPVIGPLVICGCIINSDDKNELESLGVKDSKMLSKKRREELYSYLIKKYLFKTIIIEPKEIDESLKSDNDNLNLLEAKKASEIIGILNPKKVTIDCPSTNIKEYTKTIKKLISDKNVNEDIVVVCEHKADVNHIEVSCASIIAKVTRDRIIDEIKEKHKDLGDVGSGYPSDRVTREFVAKNYANKSCKEIFRKTWQTYIEIAQKNKQNKLEKFF